MKTILINKILLNCLIALCSIVLSVAVIFKFIVKSDKSADFFIHIEKIKITNMEGESVDLIDLVAENSETYILIMRLNDCYSCIAKGIEDIKSLHLSGHGYVVIAAHDSLDEVRGLTGIFSDVRFYQLSVAEQYQFIHSPMLPVLVKIKNGRVVAHRMIV